MHLKNMNLSKYIYFAFGIVISGFVIVYIENTTLKIMLISLIFLYVHLKLNSYKSIKCKNNRTIFNNLTTTSCSSTSSSEEDDHELDSMSHRHNHRKINKYRQSSVVNSAVAYETKEGAFILNSSEPKNRNRSVSLDEQCIVYDRNGKRRHIKAKYHHVKTTEALEPNRGTLRACTDKDGESCHIFEDNIENVDHSVQTDNIDTQEYSGNESDNTVENETFDNPPLPCNDGNTPENNSREISDESNGDTSSESNGDTSSESEEVSSESNESSSESEDNNSAIQENNAIESPAAESVIENCAESQLDANE